MLTHSSYGGGNVDSVVGSSVLHHLEVDAALKEIWRVLKPGGLVFFTEPNMMNPQIAVQENVPAIKERLGDSSPDETRSFDGHCNAVSLTRVLREIRLHRLFSAARDSSNMDSCRVTIRRGWNTATASRDRRLTSNPGIEMSEAEVVANQYRKDRALTLHNRTGYTSTAICFTGMADCIATISRRGLAAPTLLGAAWQATCSRSIILTTCSIAIR